MSGRVRVWVEARCTGRRACSAPASASAAARCHSACQAGVGLGFRLGAQAGGPAAHPPAPVPRRAAAARVAPAVEARQVPVEVARLRGRCCRARWQRRVARAKRQTPARQDLIMLHDLQHVSRGSSADTRPPYFIVQHSTPAQPAGSMSSSTELVETHFPAMTQHTSHL